MPKIKDEKRVEELKENKNKDQIILDLKDNLSYINYLLMLGGLM